ncbi:MAG TPA: glycogen debranching N-terminal domain-containing protein, partial [Rubrivivax sp.]|nr:glycogen debranching N-terminal domain-containing protein [Rubrivivax sp.]
MVGRLLVLKENETCVVLDAEGGTVGATTAGIYRRDTRFISEWHWVVASAQILQCGTHEDVLLQRLAIKHNQVVTALLERRLTVRSDGFDEHWQVRSTASAAQEIRLDLSLQADGRDLFAALSEVARELLPPAGMTKHYSPGSRTLQLSRTASDGVVLSVALTAVPEDLSWTFALTPGELIEFDLAVNVSSTDDSGESAPLPPYAQWR